MSASFDSSKRLVSLDALRGYTIVLMVIVNDPGSWNHVYPPLLHAEWNGITLTDLVFPFFLFIVGTSITLAYTKRLEAGADKKDLYKKIFSRAIKIMLLGWFLWLWPTFDFGGMRYVGVLPRISIVFLVCALVFLNTNWKQQVWIASLILIGYWLLMALLSANYPAAS
jgi:predicted acyltransferase